MHSPGKFTTEASDTAKIALPDSNPKPNDQEGEVAFRQITQPVVKFPEVPCHESPLMCLKPGTQLLPSLLESDSTPCGSLR